MATGFPTKANYAAGDILTAANMNDLSGTVNYLQYMPPRNALLNSNFSVWQRGTSVALAASTAAASGYSADRWDTATGANQAITISRQATADTTNLPNIQYCARYQRNSGQTGTSILTLAQNLETINSIPFVGKSVTWSFYARAGANYSATSSILSTTLIGGTGTDQNVLTGFTGQTSISGQSSALTTTWQRFSYTATIPTTVTQLALIYQFTPTGTAGANDYFEITGVQLELGSVANTYQPNGATYQAELAACQRYLPAVTFIDNAQGYAYATNSMIYSMQFPVPARIAPTGISITGSTFTATVIATNYTSVTPVFNSASISNGSVVVTSGVTATLGNVGRFTGGTILWTGCEL